MSGNEKLERELESFLAEENSRAAALYRQLPRHEPDAKLDQSVLAMARAAVAPKRSRNYWMPGLSAAAIALLVVGVSYRTVLQRQSDRATPPSPPAAQEAVLATPAAEPQPQAFPASPAAAQPPPAAMSAPPPLATPAGGSANDAMSRRKTAELPRVPSAPPLRETVAPSQAASAVVQRQNPADKSAAKTSPAPMPERSVPLQQFDAKILPPTESEKQNAAPSVSGRMKAEDSNDASMLNSPPAPSASAPKPAMQRAPDNTLYPEHWIENIQQLLRDGKRDQALRSLNEFRAKYPDYALPDELRDLK